MKALTDNRRHQGGFSLVELTVATALFSLGMGSLSLLYLLSVQGMLEARLQTTAVTHADSLTEMVLMAPDARERFIRPASNSGVNCSHSNLCTPEQIADSFMESWQAQLENVLPHGGGTVCRDSTPFDGSTGNFACDGTGDAVVKVVWREFTSKDGSPVPHRLVSTLPLP
jgi:prepilin-type N-terminal cleavage/methylation domain-containing protein